jgi:hypothetical protein
MTVSKYALYGIEKFEPIMTLQAGIGEEPIRS